MQEEPTFKRVFAQELVSLEVIGSDNVWPI